jgi:hypothetical protein
LILENGSVSSATIQGFTDLISQDPTAYWDGTSVISSLESSPRVITLPAFDPSYSPGSGKTQVILTKFLSVFIESVGPGSRINGRIVDAGTNTPLPINPTTWGGLKRKY